MSTKQEIQKVLRKSASIIINLEKNLSDEFKAEQLAAIDVTCGIIDNEEVHYHAAIKIIDDAIVRLKKQISAQKRKKS